MPENTNNNFNNELPETKPESLDLPSVNQVPEKLEQTPVTPATEENKPLIEIPQAYYDQLAKKEHEAHQKEEEDMKKYEEMQRTNSEFSKILFMSVLGAIITFVSLYLTINKTELAIFVIPLYIIVGTITSAIKNKKESTFPVSIMVGGMTVAVLTFVLSTVQEDKMDMWTYYTIAGAITAFVGLIISNIITKIVCDRKNIKALETVGYTIFFAAVVAVPTYLYINYRDVFYRFVFQKQVVVQAETEEEFTMKTLKARYNIDFTCDKREEKHSLTKDNRKVITRLCSDTYGNKMEVNSIAYNEGANEYVVIDTYMDTMILSQAKTTLEQEVKSATQAEEVKVALYPSQNCTFVGDCVDCDEYFENYTKETDIDNQFKVSTELNLKNALIKKPQEYLNSEKYKMIIEVKKTFDFSTITQADCIELVDKVLNELNKKGYKNNYGYTISIIHKYDSSKDSLLKTLYVAEGKTSDDKTFKDPVRTDDQE